MVIICLIDREYSLPVCQFDTDCHELSHCRVKSIRIVGILFLCQIKRPICCMSSAKLYGYRQIGY